MMNADIMFRGKCKVSGEWVSGDLIHGVGAKHGRVYILPRQVNLAYVKHCDPLDGVEVFQETVSFFETNNGWIRCDEKMPSHGESIKNAWLRQYPEVNEHHNFYSTVGQMQHIYDKNL